MRCIPPTLSTVVRSAVLLWYFPQPPRQHNFRLPQIQSLQPAEPHHAPLRGAAKARLVSGQQQNKTSEIPSEKCGKESDGLEGGGFSSLSPGTLELGQIWEPLGDCRAAIVTSTCTIFCQHLRKSFPGSPCLL